jgi:hypothetical protein
MVSKQSRVSRVVRGGQTAEDGGSKNERYTQEAKETGGNSSISAEPRLRAGSRIGSPDQVIDEHNLFNFS